MAPAWTITFAVAANVVGVVITSSPGPTPVVISARCSPAVAESSAIACFAPVYAAKAVSNARERGPADTATTDSQRENVVLLDRGPGAGAG